jgi:cytochrome oxidase Cu insertion factor (SCO1/SenC/PrrC family)/thiol-disulfide isomerase/thioredoxin
LKLVDLRRVLVIAAAAMALLFATVSVLAAIRHSSAKPSATASVPAPLAAGTALARPRQVPAMNLISSDGRPMSVRSWRGKWVILAPTMTLCHEVCPMTTGVLEQVESRLRHAGLANRVVVATATVDPWRDSPARLRAYERLTGVNFTQLTGTKAQIHRLWNFFGVAYSRVPQGNPPDIDWMTHKPETFDVQHTDALFLLDPSGQERIADNGMPQYTGRLPSSLYRLLNDQGRSNLAHPQFAWTTNDVLDDLYYLMDRNIPATSAPFTAAPSLATARVQLSGSPQSLAALHGQAGQLLGSDGALQERLRSLRGFPVVINAWASWCPPCRSEFPLFGAAAARYGRQVAFVGVDTNDSSSSGHSFLATHPVSYPSYQSSSADLGWLAGIEAMPTTVFVNRAGHVVEVHPGQYQTESTLDDDVERLLAGR